ncbi:class D sortase [Alicyclobacillus sp. SO9]|uniref:class D sortase n=1 Tax=Alicyclobacillus sp. SO9 TaxID=2665646 RepID=UPI0018E7F649|nr:class D sortase [Alicyclobacillus sp. SO9]QQE80104.1 class D sortase [Alicyclobacillus sp. SO9]
MPSERKFRNLVRKALLWLGIGIIAIGVAQLLRIPLTYARVAYSQRVLNHQQKTLIVTTPSPKVKSNLHVVEYKRNALYPRAAKPGNQPQTRSDIGKLTIPKLGLTAPIRQGTALSILASTAGHLSTSVLPGEVGTSIIAAHDVTYFHHIDALKPGDVIEVQTSQGTFEFKVRSHQIIHVGTDVVNTSYPSLVLETCYPLNALHLVNRRYIVKAVLVHSSLSRQSFS